MTGIVSLYYSFLRHLRTNPSKLAAMQLSGKLELWLTSEFAYHVYHESKGKRFAVMNTGTPTIGERKIDLVVISGKLVTNGRKTRIVKNDATARSLIELKYFCNFRQLGFGSACDEIGVSLNSLSDQLYRFDGENVARFKVNLTGKFGDVYGLVFASHASTDAIGGTAKQFLRRIYEDAAAKHLRYHDVQHPWLKPVYENEPLRVLGRDYNMSLYAGLWRAKSIEGNVKVKTAVAG